MFRNKNEYAYESKMHQVNFTDIPTRITALDLYQNTNFGDNDVNHITQHYTNLTSLLLYGNNITDQGAANLATSTSLTSLDLRSNSITEKGAAALVENTCITNLVLSSNRIGDKGAVALSTTSVLRNLGVACCSLFGEGIDALAKNTTIETLDLSNNTITAAAANTLKQNTTLSYILMQNAQYCLNEDDRKEISERLGKNRENIKMAKKTFYFFGKIMAATKKDQLDKQNRASMKNSK